MKTDENASDQVIVRAVLLSLVKVSSDASASPVDRALAGLSAIAALSSVQNQQYRAVIIKRVASISKVG